MNPTRPDLLPFEPATVVRNGNAIDVSDAVGPDDAVDWPDAQHWDETEARPAWADGWAEGERWVLDHPGDYLPLRRWAASLTSKGALVLLAAGFAAGAAVAAAASRR